MRQKTSSMLLSLIDLRKYYDDNEKNKEKIIGKCGYMFIYVMLEQ